VKPPAHMTDARLSRVSDYDRHVGKRLRETFKPGQGFLPPEPRQSRGRQVNLPRRTTMNGRKMLACKILATAAFCTLLTGAGLAQVTGQTIQERKNDQQGRIAHGARNGTPGAPRSQREPRGTRDASRRRGPPDGGRQGSAHAPAEQYFAIDFQGQAQRTGSLGGQTRPHEPAGPGGLCGFWAERGRIERAERCCLCGLCCCR
jgi:hypothetical protein